MEDINFNTLPMWKYVEILQCELADYDSAISKNIDIISILYDIDYDSDEFNDMDIDDMGVYTNGLHFIQNTNPPKSNISNFKNNGIEYHLVDFAKLPFGNIIDIDYYISYGWLDYWRELLAILFKTKDVNGDYIIEYKLSDRVSLFEDMSVAYVYNIIVDIIEYRNKLLTETYTSIFSKQEKEEIDEDELTPLERRQLGNEIEKNKALSQFMWDPILIKLSNGDITKEDKILNMGHIYIFNRLTYLQLTS